MNRVVHLVGPGGAGKTTTFVLLPSAEVETCVRETVRRQLRRPFARSAEREEQVIRERYVTHMGLPARKVETMEPLEAVVGQLVVALSARSGRASGPAGPPTRVPAAG